MASASPGRCLRNNRARSEISLPEKKNCPGRAAESAFSRTAPASTPILCLSKSLCLWNSCPARTRTSSQSIRDRRANLFCHPEATGSYLTCGKGRPRLTSYPCYPCRFLPVTNVCSPRYDCASGQFDPLRFHRVENSCPLLPCPAVSREWPLGIFCKLLKI